MVTCVTSDSPTGLKERSASMSTITAGKENSTRASGRSTWRALDTRGPRECRAGELSCVTVRRMSSRDGTCGVGIGPILAMPLSTTRHPELGELRRDGLAVCGGAHVPVDIRDPAVYTDEERPA